MANENDNGLGAMMQAQSELSGVNAARQQNLLSEQAFLQQQQAAGATMMQAAQIGTSPSVNQQVGGMNPQTQAILSQYGINGTPKPGKTTTSSNMMQSQGNTRIENKTITNNDIKIVTPNIPMSSGGGGDAGNQAKFKTWLSNAFAKQQSDYEVQRRVFARKDRDLEKQSNKMMRNLEKSTKSLSERLNPENLTKPLGSQFKTLVFLLGTSILPTLVENLGDKFGDKL
jgi:hypothetical protein